MAQPTPTEELLALLGVATRGATSMRAVVCAMLSGDRALLRGALLAVDGTSFGAIADRMREALIAIGSLLYWGDAVWVNFLADSHRRWQSVSRGFRDPASGALKQRIGQKQLRLFCVPGARTKTASPFDEVAPALGLELYRVLEALRSAWRTESLVDALREAYTPERRRRVKLAIGHRCTTVDASEEELAEASSSSSNGAMGYELLRSGTGSLVCEVLQQRFALQQSLRDCCPLAWRSLCEFLRELCTRNPEELDERRMLHLAALMDLLPSAQSSVALVPGGDFREAAQLVLGGTSLAGAQTATTSVRLPVVLLMAMHERALELQQQNEARCLTWLCDLLLACRHLWETTNQQRDADRVPRVETAYRSGSAALVNAVVSFCRQRTATMMEGSLRRAQRSAVPEDTCLPQDLQNGAAAMRREDLERLSSTDLPQRSLFMTPFLTMSGDGGRRPTLRVQYGAAAEPPEPSMPSPVKRPPGAPDVEMTPKRARIIKLTMSASLNERKLLDRRRRSIAENRSSLSMSSIADSTTTTTTTTTTTARPDHVAPRLFDILEGYPPAFEQIRAYHVIDEPNPAIGLPAISVIFANNGVPLHRAPPCFIASAEDVRELMFGPDEENLQRLYMIRCAKPHIVARWCAMLHCCGLWAPRVACLRSTATRFQNLVMNDADYNELCMSAETVTSAEMLPGEGRAQLDLLAWLACLAGIDGLHNVFMLRKTSPGGFTSSNIQLGCWPVRPMDAKIAGDMMELLRRSKTDMPHLSALVQVHCVARWLRLPELMSPEDLLLCNKRLGIGEDGIDWTLRFLSAANIHWILFEIVAPDVTPEILRASMQPPSPALEKPRPVHLPRALSPNAESSHRKVAAPKRRRGSLAQPSPLMSIARAATNVHIQRTAAASALAAARAETFKWRPTPPTPAPPFRPTHCPVMVAAQAAASGR